MRAPSTDAGAGRAHEPPARPLSSKRKGQHAARRLGARAVWSHLPARAASIWRPERDIARSRLLTAPGTSPAAGRLHRGERCPLGCRLLAAGVRVALVMRAVPRFTGTQGTHCTGQRAMPLTRWAPARGVRAAAPITRHATCRAHEDRWDARGSRVHCASCRTTKPARV